MLDHLSRLALVMVNAAAIWTQDIATRLYKLARDILGQRHFVRPELTSALRSSNVLLLGECVAAALLVHAFVGLTNLVSPREVLH